MCGGFSLSSLILLCKLFLDYSQLSLLILQRCDSGNSSDESGKSVLCKPGHIPHFELGDRWRLDKPPAQRGVIACFLSVLVGSCFNA